MLGVKNIYGKTWVFKMFIFENVFIFVKLRTEKLGMIVIFSLFKVTV